MKLNFSFKRCQTILYVFNVIFSCALLYFYGKSIETLTFKILEVFGFFGVFLVFTFETTQQFSNGWLSKPLF